MSVLTMLLQVTMQMIEGEIQQDSADLTQHLEQMYGQLDQQRIFLQALINQQQGHISPPLHPPGQPETTNAAAYRESGHGPKEPNTIRATQSCDEQEPSFSIPDRGNTYPTRWKCNTTWPRNGRLRQFNHLGSHVRKSCPEALWEDTCL